MKRIIFLMVVLSIGAAAFSQKKAVKAPFTKGVNFSVWLEKPSVELVSSNYFCEQDFKNVKALGCDAIRLPVHFENLSSGAPDYIIDKKVFSILDKAVKWASENQIYLILDNHSWSPDKGTAKDIEKRLVKYWPQIAARYKNSDKYLMYELLNEPHEIDNSKWGKIQQRVINAIRAVDQTHTIIVGGAEWNSYSSMLALPEFSDKNLIYTFHYYEPMLFTHQGANWSDGMARFRDIPFPYSKEKMPPRPSNSTATENWYYENYKQASNPKTMQAPFDKIAEFSTKRKAPVWCGEFGVYMAFSDNDDRVEWYKTVTEYLDSRNIARTSWDYYDSFGVFKKGSSQIFPDDLNKEILAALKYDIPQKNQNNLTWNEKAKKTGNYTIYSNGFSNGFIAPSWFEGYEEFCSLEHADSGGYIIDLGKLKPYTGFRAQFIGGAKFQKEKDEGYSLQFEARTKQNGIRITAYFINSDKTGEEWRAATNITNAILPADGKWHTIKIPLKNFMDIGAWNNDRNEWVNSRGIFDWNDIRQIVFDNQENELTDGVSFREIRLAK